jgi:uncharacterized OB-fold protein
MRRFTVKGRNTGFTCTHCGTEVPPLAGSSCRNHCPRCLHSLHVDINPGDRANPCRGLLEPVGVVQDGKKGWIIVSRCRSCGEIRRNRAALDDPDFPDDYEALLGLAGRPVPDR